MRLYLTLDSIFAVKHQNIIRDIVRHQNVGVNFSFTNGGIKEVINGSTLLAVNLISWVSPRSHLNVGQAKDWTGTRTRVSTYDDTIYLHYLVAASYSKQYISWTESV